MKDLIKRKQKIKQLRKKGLTYTAIGKKFNLSRQRIHQIINPEKYKEIKKRYSQTEGAKIRVKKWRIENKEYYRKWYIKNRKKIREYQSKWYWKNRDEVLRKLKLKRLKLKKTT